MLAAEKRAKGIFNITDDEPAPPQDVVAFAAKLLDVEVPPLIPFEKADLSPMGRSFYGENKKVSNAKSKEELAMSYSVPDYRAGREGRRFPAALPFVLDRAAGVGTGDDRSGPRRGVRLEFLLEKPAVRRCLCGHHLDHLCDDGRDCAVLDVGYYSKKFCICLRGCDHHPWHICPLAVGIHSDARLSLPRPGAAESPRA